MTVLPLQEKNRFPVAGLEAPIDSLRLRFHFGEQVMVPLDVGAAGCADLQERELSLILGIFFQKALDRAKAFMNSLGVIHAVYASSYKTSFTSQPLCQR